nr:SEC-C metal-binding domain-containing protein [Vagococcus entomophilus]
MAQKEFSESKFEKLVAQCNEWLATFSTTDEYTGLSNDAQKKGTEICETFVKVMYKEELRTPREWTATALEAVVQKQMDSDTVPVLTAFITFLSEQGKLSNGPTLLRKLEKLSNEAPKGNEHKKAKTKKSSAASKRSFTKEEIEMFNLFPMGNYRYQSETAEEAKPAVDFSNLKVGRNEPCPCGSGKKFKKCHGK